jgi:hypothetical protein
VRYHVYASSFADPRDGQRFRRCKKNGGSDNDCYKVGDSGIGCWDQDTSEGSGPSCALPPETMIDIWGSVEAAHNEKVFVECGERSVTCSIKDKMPHIRHITNGARIDLNPDACDALGLEPPVMHFVTFTPLRVL